MSRLIGGPRNGRVWRAPSLCVCGARMELEVVYDVVVLKCNACGATGKSTASISAASLSAPRAEVA